MQIHPDSPRFSNAWEADQIIIGVAALGGGGREDLLGRKTILAAVVYPFLLHLV